MFATATYRTAGVRIAGFVTVVVIAAILGLAVGAVLNAWTQDESRTATAVFSAEALEGVRITRGDVALSAAETDYPLRHPARTTISAPISADLDNLERHRFLPEAGAGTEQLRPQGHPQLE